MFTISEAVVVFSVFTFWMVVNLAPATKLHFLSVIQFPVFFQLGCGVNVFSASFFHWAIQMRK